LCDKSKHTKCILMFMTVTVIFVGAAVLTLTLWEILYRKYARTMKLRSQIFIATALIILFVLLVLGGFITLVAVHCNSSADCA